MRAIAFLAVAGLVVSAVFAPRAYRARPGELPEERFVEADPLARAAWGKEHGALGTVFAGYEEAAAGPAAPAAALMGRIRAGFHLGAVAIDQPDVGRIVLEQARAYIEHRDRIDPDGAGLQAALREWIDHRARDGLDHEKISANIFLAARGSEEAGERLWEFVEAGPFYKIVFEYARRMHPAWRAIDPLARRYLESDDLDAVIEAGAAVVEYKALFGKGQETFDRYLPVIRKAFRDMHAEMRTFDQANPRIGHGLTALLGIATLANLGYEEERRLIERMHARGRATLLAYPAFAEELRIAYVWAGLRPLRKDAPPSSNFQLIPHRLWEYYFRAAAHRAATLMSRRTDAVDEKLEEEIEFALDVVRTGWRSPDPWTILYCLVALRTLDPERAPDVVQETMDGSGPPSLVAANIAERLPDPVAAYLEGLSAPRADHAALAAVSLLDLGNDLPCIERRK